MLATLRKIIAWAGKNVIKTTVLIALLIYLGVEVSGLISHRNSIKNAVMVTAFAPPVGSTGGTYA